MTDEDLMAGKPHREDAAAYALGALDPPEAEAFERHLESCTICCEEVTVYRQIADSLPAAIPQYQLPKSLRRRVLNEVRADARARAREKARAAGRRGIGHNSILALARPALARSSLALASGALVVIAAVVLAALALSSGAGQERLVQAQVTTAQASAQIKLSGGHGELIMHHLAPPRTGHVYELWIQRPHERPAPTPALFSVDSRGAADIGVPGDIHGVSAVMVTEEPDGGSATPTQPPVIVAHL